MRVQERHIISVACASAGAPWWHLCFSSSWHFPVSNTETHDGRCHTLAAGSPLRQSRRLELQIFLSRIRYEAFLCISLTIDFNAEQPLKRRNIHNDITRCLITHRTLLTRWVLLERRLVFPPLFALSPYFPPSWPEFWSRPYLCETNWGFR